MQEPIPERRRYARIRMSGQMLWHDERHRGVGKVCDVSPHGVGLEVAAETPLNVGSKVSLHMPLDEHISWYVARNARVVQRTERPYGPSRIGVAIPEQA